MRLGASFGTETKLECEYQARKQKPPWVAGAFASFRALGTSGSSARGTLCEAGAKRLRQHTVPKATPAVGRLFGYHHRLKHDVLRRRLVAALS